MTIPPLFFALLMWFIGTGAVVWLDSRPRHTFRTSHRLAGLVAVLAMAVVYAKGDDTSWQGAYIGFGAAILIWGWHEMGFLMGFVAGPRHTRCPPGAVGWERFRLATATVIHHEIALATNLLVLVAITWGQPNQAAPLTFALLFALRLSAKLNLFFGVPNLSDEIFPAHLAYLKTYFGEKSISALYPFSVLACIAVTYWAWTSAEAAATNSGPAVTATLLAGLAALGLVEHIFLVLPVRDAKMWRWASASKPTPPTAAKAATIE